MLAEICDSLPGADVDVVADALGSDSRIGRKYLTGATGYGGPCFPRDNIALSRLAENLGAAADIAVATDRINRHQNDRLMAIILRSLPEGSTVTILGLSYKPDTSVVDRSQGIELARSLYASGYRVVVHDPMALESARQILGECVIYEPDLNRALAQTEAVVIMTPWPVYRTISAEVLMRSEKKIVVIDCWRVLDREVFGEVIDLRWIGYGQRLERNVTPAASRSALNGSPGVHSVERTKSVQTLRADAAFPSQDGALQRAATP
jgi:UDPglucose 6-dehydrogenase